MPTYDFINKETKEVFTKLMKISDMEQYLQDNPLVEIYHGQMAALMDPVRLGVRKPDQGFREVLQRVHEKTPGSRLNTTADI